MTTEELKQQIEEMTERDVKDLLFSIKNNELKESLKVDSLFSNKEFLKRAKYLNKTYTNNSIFLNKLVSTNIKQLRKVYYKNYYLGFEKKAKENNDENPFKYII
jgi:flagellar biosynthesis regulator FlbT